MKGMGKEGLPYAKAAREIFHELGNQGNGKGWEAKALSALVNAYASRGDSDTAIKIAQDGVEKLKASGDKMTEVHAMSLLSDAYACNEQPEDALRTAETALALV